MVKKKLGTNATQYRTEQHWDSARTVRTTLGSDVRPSFPDLLLSNTSPPFLVDEFIPQCSSQSSIPGTAQEVPIWVKLD